MRALTQFAPSWPSFLSFSSIFSRRPADNSDKLRALLDEYRTIISENNDEVGQIETNIIALERRACEIDDETAQAEIIASGLERLLGIN